MRFAPDPDALAFADTVRALLAKHGPAERSTWDALAELGALSITVPEAAGGLGLDARAQVVVLEEIGRAALAFPFVETAAVAMPLVAAQVGPSAIVTSDLGGALVPWAADADALLLRGEGGVHLVTADAISVEPVPTLDPTRRLGRVHWAAEGGGATLVTDDPVAISAAVDRGAFATAAVLVGLAQQMLDLALEYAKQRVQFGVPIGSFQAVKHKLADAALAITFARPAVHRAAVSLATADPLAARDVSMAKAMASTAALTVAAHALQCHGAIGYTTEHELHRFHVQATALARAWGTPAHHRTRVGRALSAI